MRSETRSRAVRAVRELVDESWGRIPLLAMAVISGVLTGCPSNLCLLTVNGRCEWSTCPDGAEYQSRTRRCVCRADRISLQGSCLSPQQANQYCGKGFHFESGGCAPNACPRGYLLDQETGYCITPQQATAVANNMGVQVGQNQQLGCPPGEQLVVEGPQAACVPLPKTCGRDEEWDGRQCRKLAQCPPGSTFDPASRACIQFAKESGSKYTVNLATWLRTEYGPDGGEGTQSFCSAFNKHPIAFGVSAGRSQKVRIAVQVQIPNRGLPNAFVFTTGVSEPDNQPVPSKGALEIQQAAEGILNPLKAGGGETDVVMGVTTVSCTVVNSSKPKVVTVAGGA